MKSIFTDKNSIPTLGDLKLGLGNTIDLWKKLEAFTNKNYPLAKAVWNYSGDKYGWSYQIKDNKRVIIYLLPRDHFFRVAFVFGAKAMDQIIESDIAESIKKELLAAKQYAEGRGIRIEVKDPSNLEDIKKLIKIKISN